MAHNKNFIQNNYDNHKKNGNNKGDNEKIEGNGHNDYNE